MSNFVIERQKAHIASLAKSNFRYGLTVGAAFVRGIRKVGYKSTATAIDELVDNSQQAGAQNVHVVFGYEGTRSDRKPEQIAVIDDGVGMIPEMIRLAVLWGGTDRENDRSGIGRFGYGLPSSCISQGQRFEVYSKVAGGKWYVAVVDLKAIENGKFTTEQGDIVVPPAKPAKLPTFVEEYVARHFPEGGLESGTVVLIDKLDSLTWKTANALQDNLLKHFGVTYHKIRSQFELYVNGIRCEPIDPLFLTPGYRWYDLDADRAQALDPMTVDVKDKETGRVLGRIHIRFAYMPIGFASVDKGAGALGKNANERFWVMKEYNGFIVSRMGRVIDVVTSCPLTTFVNNDRYFKIEMDFDASLDEEFNVPTTKQQVNISERVWEILREQGLLKAIEQLRSKYREAKAKHAVDAETRAGGKRPSEAAMEKTKIVARPLPPAVVERQMEEGRRRLQQEAERRAAEGGKSVADAAREIEAELAGKPYKVAKRAVPGGSFFEVEQIGGTKTLWLNTATRFFQDAYAGPTSSPQLRGALEVLLFSIGDRILEGGPDLRAIYVHEVPEWSKKLEFALAHLAQGISASTIDDADQASASAEAMGAAAD